MIDVLRSMTGYGRSESNGDGVTFRVEIRSVNHRFLETVVRMPRELLALEEMIKKEVRSSFTRGRMEVFVTVNPDELGENQANLDWAYAEQVVQSVRELKAQFGLTGELSVSDVVRIPDMFVAQEADTFSETWCEPLLQSVRQACAALLDMRLREGAALAQDMRRRVARVQDFIEDIRQQAPRVVADYRERMAERLQDYLKEVAIDESRLLTEAALYAERCNIDEELTRLDSHCKQCRQLLSLSSPVGRKLDFLVQEMNREINTIGSKANDLTISRMVVEIKSELEKMREQLQNIE